MLYVRIKRIRYLFQVIIFSDVLVMVMGWGGAKEVLDPPQNSVLGKRFFIS